VDPTLKIITNDQYQAGLKVWRMKRTKPAIDAWKWSGFDRQHDN